MTQRPNGRGPLPAKDVVNLGDPLPVEQCVTALKPLAAPEENLPDWAQSAPESAPNTATRLTIDDSAVHWHLQLLGLDENANIRGIPHKGKKGPAFNGKAWQLDRAEQWQAEGCGVYLQVNPGGTKATEITSGVALFFEHDNRPVLEQIFALVRPGGLLLYETFGKGNEIFGRPSNPEFLLCEGELTSFLSDRFTMRHQFFGQRRNIYPDRPPAIICQFAAQRHR